MLENLGIPKKYKTAIILTIIAFFLLLLILIINAVNRAKIKGLHEINNLPESDKLNFELKKYNEFARKLEAAFMNASSYTMSTMVTPTAGWGTKTEWIYEVFREMKSKNDILQLILAYGKRSTSWGSSGMNLMEAIDSELDNSELLKLNKIISNNGIDFKFYRL